MSRNWELIESIEEKLKEIEGICTLSFLTSDLITIRDALHIASQEDQTQKYAGMIEAIECDFSLAASPEKKYGLDELQLKIEQGDGRLLSDIELLQELSYGIRHGTIKIVKQPKEGVSIEE